MLHVQVSSTVDYTSPTESTAVRFSGSYGTCWAMLRELFELPHYLTPNQTSEQIAQQIALTSFLNGRSIAPLVHPVYGRFSVQAYSVPDPVAPCAL